MNNRIVITEYEGKILVVFLNGEIPVKIAAVDSYDEMTQTVYLGRVSTVKTNINSCFVKYNSTTGFLKTKNLKPETVLPVMLKKETAPSKEDELTDKISVSGVYIVVSDDFNGVHYSNRLTGPDKEKLSELQFDNVIFRNNSKSADLSSIKNEYELLRNKLNDIHLIKDKRTCNSIIYKGLYKIIELIISEDFNEYSEIITDIEDVYLLINRFIKEYNDYSINVPLKVTLYNDDISLKLLLSLSSKIDRATNRKVYLKSDAYIIIDCTEAMTVIDVNSGTTVFKGDKASVIHRINVEAAKEIALQLKLRNLSGIIIVDFINEYKKEYEKELVDVLKEQLADDDCHAICHGMTKLGLVEITRNRKYKPLKEQLWK